MLQWQTDCKSCVICRIAPFSMTLNDPNPDFKVTPLFDAECLRNGTRINYNGLTIGTYTRHTQVPLQRTLSDLE